MKARDFKGRMHFWACAFVFLKTSFSTRPQRWRWRRLWRDIVAVVRTYRAETDFSKWTFAVEAGRDEQVLKDATDTSKVIPMELHRKKVVSGEKV